MEFLRPLFAILPVLWIGACGCEDYLVGTYRLGEDAELRLHAEGCWEYSQSLFYTIEHEGQVLIPKTWFTAVHSDPISEDYFIRKNQSGSVFAVLPKGETGRVAILYDVKSKLSWPRMGETETSEAARVRALAMLKELKTEPGMEGLRIIE